MSDATPSAVNARIKAARLEAGLTQAQLAAAAGLTQSRVSILETRPTSYPTPREQVALPRALKVSRDWLLGLAEAEQPAHDQDVA